jgi:hypothetical protein
MQQTIWPSSYYYHCFLRLPFLRSNWGRVCVIRFVTLSCSPARGFARCPCHCGIPRYHCVTRKSVILATRTPCCTNSNLFGAHPFCSCLCPCSRKNLQLRDEVLGSLRSRLSSPVSFCADSDFFGYLNDFLGSAEGPYGSFHLGNPQALLNSKVQTPRHNFNRGMTICYN